MKKAQNVVWIIGICAAAFVFITYGIWFWVSKNSWISTSEATGGIFIHCLDFKFEHTKVSGSMVTRFEPIKRAHVDRNDFPLVLAAATWEGEFFGDYWGNIGDELRASKRISIFEGVPIGNHIPDMNFKDKDGNLLGTVSFTLWPDKITALVDRMVANFKSTNDISIEQKIFMRSVKKTEDERCLVE